MELIKKAPKKLSETIIQFFLDHEKLLKQKRKIINNRENDDHPS